MTITFIYVTRRRLQICVCLCLVAAFAALFFWQREPSYHGRTLSNWLSQLYDTPLMESNKVAEAQMAIRQIGAAKAVPYLLRMSAAEDGAMRRWILEKNETWRLHFLDSKDAETLQQVAVDGFEVLGTNAAPAIPELNHLLNDPQHASRAIQCLIAIGVPAEKAVTEALRHPNPEVRSRAAFAFAWVTDDVKVVIEQMKQCLDDPDPEVRASALKTIGEQLNAPDLAVPVLISALTNSATAAKAADELKHFGTNAASAFPSLSNNAFASVSQIANAACSALIAISPKDALPLVLQQTKLPDADRRLFAVRKLCYYPFTNADVIAAVELAASDSSTDVAHAAQQFITDLRQKGRPEDYAITNDPSYGGRTLGQWLRKRGGDQMFSPGAQNAIKEMGTNAIPTLLERLVYVRPPYGLPAPTINNAAMEAFITLGEKAKPALPQLRELMDNTNQNIALHAMLSTLNMGSDGMTSLLCGLTNRHADVRSECANYLGQDISANYPEIRKAAIPLLMQLTNDPEQNVRTIAHTALKEIAPNVIR